MRLIRLYRFRPTSQPPHNIKQMNQWFQKEVEEASIEPIDSYEITEQGPTGNPNNLPLAKKIFQGLLLLNKIWLQFKDRWS